jgi:hypothetical protein
VFDYGHTTLAAYALSNTRNAWLGELNCFGPVNGLRLRRYPNVLLTPVGRYVNPCAADPPIGSADPVPFIPVPKRAPGGELCNRKHPSWLEWDLFSPFRAGMFLPSPVARERVSREASLTPGAGIPRIPAGMLMIAPSAPVSPFWTILGLGADRRQSECLWQAVIPLAFSFQ